MENNVCKQTKCIFLGTPACPQCFECQSPANIVDNNCTLCWNCQRDEGELRGRIGKSNLSMVADRIIQREKEKLLEIKNG